MPRKGSVTFSLPPPWLEFLGKIDEALPHPVELHCLGGFALAALYALPRPTGDLDYVSAVPHQDVGLIESIAGRESKLAKKYKLYAQFVTVPDLPEEYQTRLKEIFLGRFSRLRLLGLDPHDIVLSKLTRNHPVDDADVQFLVQKGMLDSHVLQERYQRELRPNLSNKGRHDTTLRLWLEYFQEK